MTFRQIIVLVLVAAAVLVAALQLGSEPAAEIGTALYCEKIDGQAVCTELP